MAASITLSITQNSQSVADNTSNVTVKVTAKWTGGSYNATGLCTGSITIDGKKYSFTGIKFNTGETTSGSQTIMTKTVNVTHNDDGSKKLNCSASFDSRVSSGTVTASGSKTLTTILRKSTLLVENGTLGTDQTITIKGVSNTFQHKLKYVCGNASDWILGGDSSLSASISVSWTPPLSLAQQNKAGASVSVTFTLYTYSDSGDSVGSNSYTKTFSIPASVKPSVSLAVSDSTGYKGTYGAYVQGLSKLKIVSTATGNQGSTIKSYKVEVDGKTYTEADVETDAIAGTGTLKINVTVTDTRGRTATNETTISVLAYEPPKISAFAAYRCDSVGTVNSSGAYLAVKFSSVITLLNSKNTAVYTLKYKKSSATSYTTKTLSDFAGQYSVSNGIYVFPAETASSYDVTLTVNDAFKSVNKSGTGSSVKKVWSMLKKAGEIVGFALGKIAELEGVFDVDFVIRARKGIIVDAEWVDLTIADGFALYDGKVSNQAKYKVTGNVVTVMGVLTPETGFTSSTTGVNIASGIPANLRPSVNLQFVCHGSSMNHWCCSVTTGGAVTISRYGTTEPTTVPVGAWLPFCVTYQI